MRKLPSVSLDERPRSRMRRATTYLVLVIILIFSPVLYEATLLCIANWRGVFGTYTTVETPVLNSLGDVLATSSYDFKQWYRGVFQSTPWKSAYVIPFAIFWTTVLAFLLRKC